MKTWFHKLALTCAVVPMVQFAMLPAIAQAAEPAAPKATTTDVDPALWVVKDDDTTIYLFGTVHVLKPGLSWFDEAVKAAFDKSDELMLEVVAPEDPQEIAGIMMPMAIDQTGKKLPSLLTPAQLKAYQAAMVSVGLPAGQFDAFEPWFPAITLSVLPLTKLDYDPEQGAEKQLTHFAKASSKPIKGLETMQEQLGFFDVLPEASQLAFLNAVVKDIDQMGPMLDKLVVLWGKGDPDALATLLNENMAATPELMQTLLYDRNARWAEQLQARMEKPGTLFVAVGAGHLAGKHSVQDYLKERGLTATRVDY